MELVINFSSVAICGMDSLGIVQCIVSGEFLCLLCIGGFFMSNLREVKDDILKNWLEFKEEELCALTCDEDRKHHIYFDEISANILRNVPKENKKYVQKQLNKLDENFMDYIFYWNEKYYRNGFCDGVQLIGGCLSE